MNLILEPWIKCIKLWGLYNIALNIFIVFSQINELRFLFCIKMVELLLDLF